MIDFCFCLLSCTQSVFEKKSTLKEKNLLLPGSKFFSLRVDPFSDCADVQESKQEVIKVVTVGKIWHKIFQVYPIPLSLSLLVATFVFC